MKNKLYLLKCILLAIGLSGSFILKFNEKGVIASYTNTGALTAFVIGVFFIWFFYKYLKDVERRTPFIILSLLLSFLLLFGNSYDLIGSAKLVIGNIELILFSILKYVSYFYMFNTSINLIYDWITNYRFSENTTLSKLGKLFNDHPFVFCFITILICYLPYLIAYYPGIMCNDPLNQIKEFMGIHTRYLDSVIIRDPSVTITNFNPVLHTLLLGSTFKLGHILGNNNLGMFLYTIIQSTVLISILAYAICYMKKEKVNTKLLYIALGIFALVPVFPFYALANNKDTLFSAFMILYVILIYDVIKNDYKLKNYIFLFLVSILIVLFRNNGIYTVLITMPFLILGVKKKRIELLVVLVLVVSSNIFYGKILLPKLGISDTSIREALSIPFQQTARLVKYHDNIIDSEDKEIIDKILEYSTLAERYNPRLSDAVKNKYNIHTTNDDLKEYFGVWFKYLLKRPDVYIDATASNIYGYFYPNTSRWYIYYKYNERVKDTEFDYSYNDLKPVRNVLDKVGVTYPYIPVIGMFVNIGFVVWIYFFMFASLIVSRKKEYLPLLIPALSLILVCIASPANTYFRYAQPFIFSLPVVAFLLYTVIKKNKIEKK